jgi:hypothetical protein
VEDGIIIVKVEMMLEMILQAKIHLILSIQISASLMSNLLDIVVVIHRASESPSLVLDN